MSNVLIQSGATIKTLTPMTPEEISRQLRVVGKAAELMETHDFSEQDEHVEVSSFGDVRCTCEVHRDW